MPTTRRVYAYDENGQKIPAPLLVSIDIRNYRFFLKRPFDGCGDPPAAR
jgi:hypothetical protein